MKRPRLRSIAVAVSATVAACTFVGTAPAGASSSGATCTHLTAKMIQPLLSEAITKVTSKPVNGQQFLAGNKKVGQTCTFATASTEGALTVTVIGGAVAARAYAAAVQGLEAHVSVPGVGAKAARARVDDNGAVSTPEVASIKGSTYCSVVPQEDLIPGVGALEEAAGSTGDIGNAAWAEIADAIGTVCNRVYGSGNTTPDLSKLASAASSITTTTTDDETIPGA